MKKLLVLLLLLCFTITLSGCTPDPFEGPDGSTLKEDNVFSFTFNNGLDVQEVYTYELSNNIYFFEGPFDNNINFTNINNYLVMSHEMKRFINSFDYVIYDRHPADYGSYIDVSTKASSGNYNDITIKVSEGTDIDAYFVTENGVEIVFFYTEFTHEGETLIIPSSIFGFTHSIYDIYGYKAEKVNDTYQVDYYYRSFIVPVPPQSVVASDFDFKESNKSIEETQYLTSFFDENPTGDFQQVDIETTLYVEVNENFSIEDIDLFYKENFNGRIVDLERSFHNRGTTFTYLPFESDGKTYIHIKIKE